MAAFNKERKIPITSADLLSLGIAAAFNAASYYGARCVAGGFRHYDLTTDLDQMIPFLPVMVTVYLGCYAFWFVNYCLSVKHERGEKHQFITAHCIGEAVSFLIFILFPTTMIRVEILDTSVFSSLCMRLYLLDQADNLLPSLHCFISWLCWIGVRGNPKISHRYQWFSLLLAAAICVSTLTVKQHVLADVIAGILLAEGSYLFAGYLLKRIRHH